ncbi:MAG: hypothetical protein HY201_01070 [Nitrospirae bacterium]|nr:hypothetical protein [Candidatus Troglogloeales bacterium]
MPSSKVVKDPLRTNMEIKAFALKDMIAEAATKDKARQEIYQEGVTHGFEAGYRKGLSEGEVCGFQKGEDAGRAIKGADLAEYDKVVLLLSPLVSGLEHLTAKIAAEAEKDVIEIAVAVASRIVRKEISENPGILLEYVTEGLKNLGTAETAIIRIHPHDFELLSRKSQAILQAVEGVQCIKFEQDESLLPGDAIVESKERSVDARSDSQLSIIKRRLLAKHGEGKGS